MAARPCGPSTGAARMSQYSILFPTLSWPRSTCPGKPEFPQADGQGSVFDNIEDKNEIVKLDAARHKVVAVWPLAGCESPSGMAIDRDKHLLFSVCDGGKMAVVDYESVEHTRSAV